jgi:hypothetical protein
MYSSTLIIVERSFSGPGESTLRQTDAVET